MTKITSEERGLALRVIFLTYSEGGGYTLYFRILNKCREIFNFYGFISQPNPVKVQLETSV